MTFDELLAQVRELLQSKGRVAYRALKRRFDLDDEYLEDLKAELIDAEHVAVDEDGKVLVWVGVTPVTSSQLSVVSPQPLAPNTQPPSGERRQLTVMFCDLVGSTALSAQLDPEELREVVRAYQETCTEVIRCYDGYVAQHLGDGLLVYFGYPVAHEDDAQRTVRAGLEIIQALQTEIPSPLVGEGQGEEATGARHAVPLQVRIGIHTGLVVIGEIGSSDKREMLALGETPNIAARVQGTANPDEVVISAATYHLVEGLFTCEERGQPELKGVATPLTLYRVTKESETHSRFEVVVRKGLTPLIGREHEFGLLHERWERVKDGAGQVVLLSGEPGIGKSRLVEALKDTVEQEGARCLELRCSPYAQNSALQPVIEHLQRVLEFQGGESPEEKLRKLIVEATGRSPLQTEAVPLFAALLSLPHPDGYPVFTLSPQKQKEKTYEAIVAWLCEKAKQRAVTYAWEDLHWADPSTLELLTLFLAQVPATRLLAVLTFRPEFTLPWGSHSYFSQLTLSRLGRSQVETMVEKVTGGKALPSEIIQQIVIKTDGVPLFVEELTKSVVESVGATGRSPLQLGIPSTLRDALMARLDRLGTAKEIAQIGATIGREFHHELLHAVSSLNEETLQQGLRQLVETELVFQSGVPPQARYLFKHALVQDTAYQSLLKSRRQQLHQQVAAVLVEQFPETTETQPELVAHHYTDAGLAAQAIPYWQKAGQRAVQRSANVEAISHLTKGLELLKTFPDTPERPQQELSLQITLGAPLMLTKGYAAPEVEKTYARARELCQQVGETSQLFPVLFGLLAFSLVRAEYQTARELGEKILRLAQSVQAPALRVEAHFLLGQPLFFLGEFSPAYEHFEQGIALYDPQRHNPHVSGFAQDSGVACLSFIGWILWLRGYPDQALQRSQEALALAQELSHPFSLAYALVTAARFHLFRREVQAAQERAEALMVLCAEQGFALRMAQGTILRGWALAMQGEGEEGIGQLREGMATCWATGAEYFWPSYVAMLAEAYGKVGRVEEGLAVMAEAFAVVHKTGERFYEAELHRLKGELTLQQFNVQGSKFKVEEGPESEVRSPKSEIPSTQHLTPSTQEAEAYFFKAIEIAQSQKAKSWELRATTSLARLWQQQGKRKEAHQMLSEIYHWFTEGFDTKDLQEAKELLEELRK